MLDRRKRSSLKMLIAGGMLAAGAVGYFVAPAKVAHTTQSLVANVKPDCRIKGNISYTNRERIFHVPGQEHYAETKVSILYGERWFCSEAEARAAGWRKARR